MAAAYGAEECVGEERIYFNCLVGGASSEEGCGRMRRGKPGSGGGW